jgi:hypothetical protein
MKIITAALILLATLAAGSSLKAQGTGSASLWGVSNTHNGPYSAVGGSTCSTDPNSSYSIAFGYDNHNWGPYSVALGAHSATAGNTNGGFAMGNTNIAYGNWSVALGGQLCNSYGGGSFAQGSGSNATGDWSIAMGVSANTYGTMCRAFGQNSAAGDSANPTAISHATAFGYYSVAKANYSVAFAANSQALGLSSKALGDNSTASGQHAISLGQASTASGDYSLSLGQNSTAQAQHAVVIGPNAAAPRGSTNSWNATDPIFIVANGQTTSAKSNAIEVLKNGAVLINASGDLSMGSYTNGRKPGDP